MPSEHLHDENGDMPPTEPPTSTEGMLARIDALEKRTDILSAEIGILSTATKGLLEQVRVLASRPTHAGSAPPLGPQEGYRRHR